MTLAFETTDQDLLTVLTKFGRSVSEAELQNIYDEHILPNADRIEKAALQAKITEDDEETLGFQTVAAHEEMAEILKEEGQLPEVERCPSCLKLIPTEENVQDKCCLSSEN